MSFQAHEATVSTVQQALSSGDFTCRQIVQAFLAQIEAYNPTLNAIICLNPNALHEADLLDEQHINGQSGGPLHGVPILLKDNFDAVGMATTAGSLALKDLWPEDDADVVKALRRAGAVILGKTNLHEFAMEGLTVSSFGGQTLNPYDLSRTPGGSSGGSGAAVAASFAVMATGSDTINSLRSPASANSLYSFRPTQGLISRKGIVPVSNTQDTVGMIGRCLTDIAIALMVMSDAREQDMAQCSQVESTISEVRDCVQILLDHKFNRSQTFRIGFVHGFVDSSASPESSEVYEAMQHVRSALGEEGIALIEIQDTSTFNAPSILASMDVQMYEIRDQLNAYLSSPSRKGEFRRSYHEIFMEQSCSEFLVIPSQYQYIHTVLRSSTTDPEYGRRKARIADLTHSLTETFIRYGVDALIYPQQRNLVVPVGSPSQQGRNGILAAVTGFPVVCMPIGFSQPTDSAPIGLPIGMEILGLPWSEAKLLEVADRIDKKLNARRPPVLQPVVMKTEAKGNYDRVPTVQPRGLSNVDRLAYPSGRY